MKKKSSLFLSIVSLVLILVAIVGVVFLVEKIDDLPSLSTPSNTDKNSSESTGDPGSSGSNVSGNIYQDYYFDEARGVGYMTTGGVTRFFKKYSCSGHDGYAHHSYSFSKYENYGGYKAKFEVWRPVYEDDVITGEFEWIQTDDKFVYCHPEICDLLISYTSISNCAYPDVILDELYENVFNTSTYISYSEDKSDALG